MEDKLLRYTLRVDRLLFRKFRYIAESEGRSANKEIEQYIKRCVAEFEKTNGKIEVQIDQPLSRPPAVVPNAGLRGGCGARKEGRGSLLPSFSVGRPAVSDNVQAECLSAKSTVSASARCDARMCFGMLSEKRFLPAHLNPTAALPALHTGTAGGCEISFAGNARVGKRSGSVKRRNALLCVRNTSGTAGGGGGGGGGRIRPRPSAATP